MAKNTAKLLKSRTVLWVVTTISALVLMGYLTRDDGEAAAFMVMTGLLISFFTPNMIIVLSASVAITVLWTTLQRGVYREAFEEKKKKNGGKKRRKRDAGPLNGPESVEATIANIEEILGSGSVGSMTDSTKRLLDQQSKLGKKLEDLLPLVDKGMGVLNQVGGPQGVQKMLETLEQFSSRLPGGK